MSSKQFTAQVFGWLRQVKSDHASLPPSTALVALELIEYFNEDEGGAAWPSCKTIGDAIGVSEQTVIRTVHALAERGHLRVEWGKQGRGCSNRYWMTIKPPSVEVSSGGKPAPAEVFDNPKTSIPDKKTSIPDKKTSIALEENHLKNHCKNHHRGKTLSPDDASLREKRVAAKEDCGAFERFWQVYPKRKAKDAARKAFAAAVKRGADPGPIIASAQRYALERQGQPPRWTKHPATWLNGGCWEDEPEGAVVVDEFGNVIAIEQEEEDEGDDFETSFREFQRAAGISEDGSW
jgi:hypothetical protein